MSAHLSRAQLLLQQSRPADAEREAGLAVAQAPDHPQAYALLALSRLEQDKREPALEAARTALGLAPDISHFQYVHALVLHRIERNTEALAAVLDAIRLDPDEADNFSLLAVIQLNLRNWTDALTAAEQALALDPEHTTAANYRSVALVRLGRKTEAMQAVDFALERDPENAFSHANQGWNCLHQNNPRRAQEHFREALRLDPELEYAREGMLEALKARNWIYRGMLAYFLWMGRLAGRYQWGIVLGTYFGSKFLAQSASAHPEYKWLWWVLLPAFYGFVYLTWTSQPMFNLLLRLDRYGRHVLSPDQRVASNWFGPFFAGAFSAMIWFFVTDTDQSFFAMFFFAVLSICVAATFNRTRRHRLYLGIATGILAAIAALTWIPLPPANRVPNGFLMFFIYGFLGFQILANVLTAKRA
jgi:tetratricopeptide (TPR) repeat protein